MAGRIQGITVEIGGDTTKLQTALNGVNTERGVPVTVNGYYTCKGDMDGTVL